MTPVIRRVRLLIGDEAGPDQQFTDDEVQDVCDACAVPVDQAELDHVQRYTTGGTEWLTYRQPERWSTAGHMWEDDPTLQDATWQAVTATSFDRIRGEWTFTTSRTPPLFVTGRIHNLYAAAVGLVQRWIAAVKLDLYDFTSDGQSFARSQKLAALQALLAELRRTAGPSQGYLVRSDTAR